MKLHSDENEPATLKEDNDWSLLKGLGLTLKCAGVLVAPISLFRPEDWRVFLGTGVMLVLLGFFVSLLDEVIYRPESLPPIDAPSLRARWKTGFVILMWCSFMLNALFDLLAGLIDWLHPGEEDSSLGMLTLKWGAFMVLGPFCFSNLFLKKRRLARLWVFWHKGFILFLLTGLVALPAFLVLQGSRWLRIFGGIEQGSQEEGVIILVTWGINILLMPFWILPLFRWIFNSLLGTQLPEFFGRRSAGHHVEE